MIYFDNAATTLKKPVTVAEHVKDAIVSEQYGNPARGIHDFSLNSLRVVNQTRAKIKQLFHAGENYEVAFTQNATYALNIVLKGILKEGDHVLTTDWEHNAVLRPLYQLQQTGIQFDAVTSRTLEAKLEYSEFREKLHDNTKAVIVTHGSNVTGNLMDLTWLKAFCKKHRLYLIIDAAQTAGQVSIDLSDEEISAVCFTGHKALYGPAGVGGVCLHNSLQLNPLISGGDGVYSFEKLPPKEYPQRLEAGTLNFPAIMGLSAGLDYLFEQQQDRVTAYLNDLTAQFIEGIRQIPDLILYGEFDQIRLPVVSLNFHDLGSDIVSDALWRDYHIATRPNFHCAPLLHKMLQTERQGAVRFSFSTFNNPDEIAEGIKALKEISQR